MLGCIAAAAGCFVQVDRQGSLALRRLLEDDAAITAIDGDSYLKLEGDELCYGPVDALKLTCAGSEETKTYLSGDGLYALKVAENPLFMQDDPGVDALAAAMLENIAGYETQALRFTWRGDPALGIGHRVALTDLDGRVRAGVISRQSLRYDGTFSAVCACDVPDENNSGVHRAITPEGGLNASALVGAVDGALIKVGSVTTEKLAAGSITTEKLAAGAIETGALQAVTAKIESLTAEDITTDRLAAAMAAFTVLTAGTADFDQATVAHLVTQALNLDFGTAGEVFIRNLRVAYAQMVSAAIGNLVIQASDGKYYQIDVDSSGKVTAEDTTLTDGEIAAGLTASGRVILATDITADSLNTANLLATYALVNQIDAARIDVDTLWARQAFIAHLNTADISSNSSIQIVVSKADSALSKAGSAQSAASSAAQDAAAAQESADEAQLSASSAAQDAANAGEIASAALPRADFQRVVRIDADGLHVGDNQASGEVLIDSASVNVCLGGQVFSSFGANYVEFGNYQLRRTADGGLAFKMR